jgi:hypothetical protein
MIFGSRARGVEAPCLGDRNVGVEFPCEPAVMRAALEAGCLSVNEQLNLTPTRLGETARNALSEPDDHPLRLHNLQSCLADGRLLAQFILAEKSA